MLRLARISVSRPRATLLAWGALTAALAVIGLGVSHSLSPSVVVVSGSEAARAQSYANARFGPTQLVPILLQGPKAQLDTQGPRLVRALLRHPRTRALTAWDAGAASEGLRPSATAAMIVVSVDRSERAVVEKDQPQIERIVDRTIHAPVHASVSGQASIDRALKSHALSVALRCELIALGILLVVLLLALRAPLAAALVTALGALVVLASNGLMAILGKVITTDALAVPLAAITGLALGVGYSLLVLDRAHRLHEEPGSGRDVALEAAAAVASTGRAVLFAGAGMVLALLLASAIAPTTVIVSLGIGLLLCSALAIGGALAVTPAAIALLSGRGLHAVFGAPGTLTRDWDRLVGAGVWVRRGAPLAGALATAAMLLLAAPALTMRTGPPGITQLPSGDPARKSFEAISRTKGPGWATPYNIVVVNPHGPLTTAPLLAKLDALQTQIAHGRRVASVAGPGGLSAETKPLGTLPGQLNESSKLLVGGQSDLRKLVNGLGLAGTGARQLRSGLQSATAGAGQLHSGAGAAQSGSSQLHTGLAAAKSGSSQLSSGLTQALAGAKALQAGATSALAGSIELKNGLGSAQAPSAAGLPSLKQLSQLTSSTSDSVTSAQGRAQGASGDLAGALSALRSMGAGKGDPHYGEALSALERADSSVAALSSSLAASAPGAKNASQLASTAATQGAFLTAVLGELHSGAGKLSAGLAKLRAGNVKLAAGISELSGGGSQLSSGLARLTSGAGQLEAGLGELTSGAGQLESGLAGGVSPTGQLVNGLGVMQKGVAKFRRSLPSPKGLEELKEKSPGLFNSGYFLLAAIAGAPASAANAAGFAVNVTRGGDAAQIVVVSRYGSSSAQTAALGDRLRVVAKRFAARNRLQVAVGGPAGNLTDLAAITKARLPWVILAISVAVALMLGLALRAVLLPVVAVLADLLTAAATFGALKLLFGGDHPPLGGPGYLDPMSIVGIFTAIFGVSLVFLTVLLSDAREALLRGAGVDDSLDHALRRTAAASTGAGLAMIAAALPFAATSLLTVREFGVGFAIAVALDVFLVRPVLLPAAVQVLGRRAWWPTGAGSVGTTDRRAAERPDAGTPARI